MMLFLSGALFLNGVMCFVHFRGLFMHVANAVSLPLLLQVLKPQPRSNQKC